MVCLFQKPPVHLNRISPGFIVNSLCWYSVIGKSGLLPSGDSTYCEVMRHTFPANPTLRCAE